MQVRIALSTSPVEYPAGTVLGNLRARLMTSAGLPVTTKMLPLPTPAEVVFDGVQAGSYNFEAQQLNGAGLPIGAAFIQALVVDPPAPVAGSAVVGAAVTVI